jgi:hypothetical protein
MKRYQYYKAKECIIIIIIPYFNKERSVYSVTLHAILCILKTLEQKDGIDYEQHSA